MLCWSRGVPRLASICIIVLLLYILRKRIREHPPRGAERREEAGITPSHTRLWGRGDVPAERPTACRSGILIVRRRTCAARRAGFSKLQAHPPVSIHYSACRSPCKLGEVGGSKTLAEPTLSTIFVARGARQTSLSRG